MHDHFMHGQVNVRRINGVFLKFLLQSILPQSASYYLIRTEADPDIILPVNIFRYVRLLKDFFFGKLATSSEKY
jgi:hypothetical protein